MIIVLEYNKYYKHTYIYDISKIFCIFKFHKCFIMFNYDYYDEHIKINIYNYFRHYYYLNTLRHILYFNNLCQKNNDYGPAFIEYDENGKTLHKKYYLKNIEYSYKQYLSIKKS